MTAALTGHGAARPLLFGDPAAPLYGCLHEAAAPAGGAVIAQPVLHEYMGTHRALMQLATRLALKGITALRFDFHGAGDSAGESGAGDTGRWSRDLAAATAELTHRAGSPPVMIGLRLGATVALLRQAEDSAAEVPALVLWDPVVDGAAFLDEAAALQRERFGRADGEVFGFPLSDELRADLTGLDVGRFGRPRARRVLVVQTPGSRADDLTALTARLRDAGVPVDVRTMDASPIWRDPGKTFVPRPVLDSIVSWLTER